MNKIQKGFTLIELMIVVAIIAILAAIALAGLPELHQARQGNGRRRRRRRVQGIDQRIRCDEQRVPDRCRFGLQQLHSDSVCDWAGCSS